MDKQPLPENEPRLRRWSLTFEDAELERQYCRDMRRQTERAIRSGVLLAALLFALYGAFDVWLRADRLLVTLGVRALIVTAALLIVAFSFSSLFDRWRERVLRVFCLFMAVGMSGIIVAGGEALADRYYVGFLLVTIGSYLIIGISFSGGLQVGIACFALHLLTEIGIFGHAGTDTLFESSILLSALVVVAIGTYAFGKQRRLAYVHGLSLERARQESQHSALHDPLTGLPNRRLLMERLAHAVVRDERFRTLAAVLFIDVDAFKAVNDRHGHTFGDKLLRVVANRLQEGVRATDTVARLGGDEFVVLLEDLTQPAAATLFMDRLLEAFASDCVVDDVRLHVELSVGCALHPRDGTTPQELLAAADKAMYTMKQRHGRR